jgi:hypothetical protein
MEKERIYSILGEDCVGHVIMENNESGKKLIEVKSSRYNIGSEEMEITEYFPEFGKERYHPMEYSYFIENEDGSIMWETD